MQIKFNSCGESSLSIEVWLIQLDETAVSPIITFFILSNSWLEVIVEGARVPQALLAKRHLFVELIDFSSVWVIIIKQRLTPDNITHS